MAVGICHLCYRRRELTFEHIPPRSAYNRGRVTAIDMEEWLNQDDLDYADGRIQQRGMGDEILCGDCNSFLGRRYVPEYREWARWGRALLSRIPVGVPAVAVTIQGRKPLRFLKQCAAMVAVVRSPPFLNIHPGLRKFILDPEERRIPAALDLYLVLYRGRRARSVGGAGVLHVPTGEATVLGEVAFSPFAVLLTIGAARRQRFGRITGLTRYDVDEEADVRLELFVGEGVTPFPGDYRGRDQVEREAAAQLEGAEPRQLTEAHRETLRERIRDFDPMGGGT